MKKSPTYVCLAGKIMGFGGFLEKKHVSSQAKRMVETVRTIEEAKNIIVNI